MLQLKKRKDSSRGVRFMATICFYQDSRHAKNLLWIQKELGCGYIAIRNDGMTELRINSFVQIFDVLEQLLPYIRFKKLQAKALLRTCALLKARTLRTLSKTDMQKVVSTILVIQNENYKSRRKKTKEELHISLGLTP